MSLPVVDLEALEGAGRAAEVQKIGEACRTHGFFYVRNYKGEERFQDLERVSREFFALPEATKAEIAMSKGGAAWRGWFPVGGELTSGLPDLKEGVYFGEELRPNDRRVKAGWPMHGENLWPESVPGMHLYVRTWMGRVAQTAQLLLEGIAESLGLPASYFHHRYTARPTTLFRIFHYPATPPADGRDYAFGVGEHTDYGLLTLLAQDDNGGLQVKGRDGVWFDAPPIPGTLVCNIGDMLDRLTRGHYRSAPHRVINTSGKDRLSWPLFFDPAFDAVVEPLPMESAAAREARWDEADLEGVTGPYGDYLLGKVGKVFPELRKQVL